MNCFDKKPNKGFGFIYKYTSPSGKSYIGQTCRSMKERAGKDGQGYTNCSIFFNAIQKYGFENFKKEILEEVSLSDIDERERFYIALYNTVQPNGYNVKIGGQDDYQSRGKRIIPVIKYDLTGKFVKCFESVKAAAEDAGSNYQAIENVLNKSRKHHKNYIYRYVGEKPPEPIKMVPTHGRKVGQYTLGGKFIAEYSSANEAARAIGKNSNAGRNIRSVCSGDRQSAFGFKWKNLE